MYHFRVQLKCFCCFYHVWNSITYEEKNINGGVIHPSQHFTRQQQYFFRLFMFKGAHNNICNKSTTYVTGFIYRDPYFVLSDTISHFVDCILVVLSQRGIGENRMVDGRLGSRLRGYHPGAHRPLTLSLLMS
jgi:hypothetical protein